MKALVRPAVWLLVVAAISAGAAAAAGWSFWVVFGIAVAALLGNGLGATLEDDLPGGFNNPDGKATPRYAVVVGWVVRGVGLLLGALLLAMLCLHFYGSR